MNKDISIPGISKKELKFYLDHWGFKISEEDYERIYKEFDKDNDG